MYLAGEPYSSITKAVGKGYTRRAISGVIHRLNLPKRDNARTEKMTQVRMANKREREAAARRPPLPVSVAALGHEPMRLESGEFVTLETVTNQTCRMPVGDPGASDFHFCGHTPKPGSPYCPACHARAYVPIKPGATVSQQDKAIIAANARKTGLDRMFG